MFLLLHRGDGKVGLAVVIYLKAGDAVPTGVGVPCCLEVGERRRVSFALSYFVLWLLGESLLFHFHCCLKEVNSLKNGLFSPKLDSCDVVMLYTEGCSQHTRCRCFGPTKTWTNTRLCHRTPDFEPRQKAEPAHLGLALCKHNHTVLEDQQM